MPDPVNPLSQAARDAARATLVLYHDVAGSTLGVSIITLMVREAFGAAVAIYKARAAQAAVDNEVRARTHDLDFDAANRAFDRFIAFIDAAKADMDDLRKRLAMAEEKREVAEEAARALREELSVLRAMLRQAGCAVLDNPGNSDEKRCKVAK
jgi:hypothetical protein